MSRWTDLGKLLAKNKPCIFLNDKHQRLLVTLSLWARVRIVYGQQEDFNSLTRKHVAELTECNYCVSKPNDSIELSELKDTKQYIPWRQSFEKYLRYQGVPLSYVVRSTTPPDTFSSLMEELCYLLPVDMSDANVCRDSNVVFALLDQQVTAPIARPHFMHKKNYKDQDGRVIFMTLNGFLEGPNACARRITEAEEAILKLVWNFSPNFTPEAFTSTYMKHLNTLEQNGVIWDNFRKIRTMRHSILPNNPEIVSKNAWINNLKEKLEEKQEEWTFDLGYDHLSRLHGPGQAFE